MEREVFVVDSIHCDGCERTIGRALGDLPGVETVEAEARTSTVTVEFNPADVSRIDIAHRLDDAGFPVLGASDRDADKAQAPAVKRWTGWIVVGVGVWFLVLAVFADAFVGIFPV